MELRDLNYFQVLAEVGHVGRAAQQLGRTQPALTKSMRRLELDLGAELFERSGRGLKLTAVGELLLLRTRKLRTDVTATVREVTEYAKGEAGYVRIGSGATTTEYLLPSLCRQVLMETPKVNLQLVIGMNDVLRAALRKGQLDLVIGPLPPTESDEFENIAAMNDQVVVVARDGHPVFKKKSVGLNDLLEYHWVLPADTVAMRQWLNSAFTSRGLKPPIVQIETTSISLAPRLIAATDLLSFISRRNLGPGRAGAPLREIHLPETTMERWLGVVFNKGAYLSPAAKRIIELIRSADGSGKPTKPARPTRLGKGASGK